MGRNATIDVARFRELRENGIGVVTIARKFRIERTSVYPVLAHQDMGGVMKGIFLAFALLLVANESFGRDKNNEYAFETHKGFFTCGEYVSERRRIGSTLQTSLNYSQQLRN